MTNIMYFYGIVRDDNSSVDESSIGSQVPEDPDEEDLVESVAKPARISVIGKACLNFVRSVNLAGCPGLKGESSATIIKVQEEEEKRDEEMHERRMRDRSPSPDAFPDHFLSELVAARWPSSLDEEMHERRMRDRSPSPAAFPDHLHAELVAAGWPSSLAAAAGEAFAGWIPRRAESFDKLRVIGRGTCSNVYLARDTVSGKLVALKKVRFDCSEPDSIKHMAREILILRRLDHPNILRLEGVATSRMQYSLYLILEYVEHDLDGLAANPGFKFTLPQVKCCIHQLLSGLEHCHNRGVLHGDIKGSNLLLNNEGMLKIADFGSASFFDPDHKWPMPKCVVTLWYRPPELLLGERFYGVGVDLWSTGCVIAELLAESPIMPGRTEVEQLHLILNLCGPPSKEYWKRLKFDRSSTSFMQLNKFKRSITETFQDFPPSSLPLIETLLAIDPAERQTATAALRSEFFTTEPYACEPSNLPTYPRKEMDAAQCSNRARRLKAAAHKRNDGVNRTHDQAPRGIPAPKVNVEPQAEQTYYRQRLPTFKSQDEKSKHGRSPMGNLVEVGDSSSSLNPKLIELGYYHPLVFDNPLPAASSASISNVLVQRWPPKSLCSNEEQTAPDMC